MERERSNRFYSEQVCETDAEIREAATRDTGDRDTCVKEEMEG